MSIWHSKEKRRTLKEIAKLRREIEHEITHALGHKTKADELKKRMDELSRKFNS